MPVAKFRTLIIVGLGLPGAILWWFLKGAAPTYDPPSPEKGVWIEGQKGQYQLYREGQPFRVQGASGKGYFRELAAAGGNTLRVYDTVQLGAVLDSAHHYGLAVIADLPIPASEFMAFYRDTAQTVELLRGLLATVEQHKNHPALLLWNFGNEVDFGLEPGRRAFYRFYNGTLKQLQELDPSHPFGTSLTTYRRRELLATRLRTRGLDALGFNSFGQIINQERNLKRFDWVWKGPYLLTEWGVNGYWESGVSSYGTPLEESSSSKCIQVAQHFKEHMPHGDPRFLGSCFFYWGHRQEGTATWFGVFDADGRKTPLYATLAALWRNEQVPLPPVAVEGVSINRDHPTGDVYANPGQRLFADLALFRGSDSPLTVRWELRTEDWYTARWPYGPEARVMPLSQTPFNRHGIRFEAPEQAGPYRLYAYLTDASGFTTTTNAPIYIVR